MGTYVVYLVLAFGGSINAAVIIPQASIQDCQKAGEKFVAESKPGYRTYFCVESLK